jgi:hypothetical protein
MKHDSLLHRLYQRSILGLALALILLGNAQADPELGVMQFPEGEVQHVVRAESVPWKPCPPTLPEGCEMAVLDGDPQGEDLFTLRFRAQGVFVMPPHWHPRDERVTIISGTAAVAFGSGSRRQDATEFGPGDYYVNARHAVHTVWIEGPTVLQITGIGPWKAVPVAESPPPGSVR